MGKHVNGLLIFINKQRLRNKKYANAYFLFGAGGGARTRTSLLTEDFESSSSTNSNTPAYVIVSKRMQTILNRYYYTISKEKNQEVFKYF